MSQVVVTALAFLNGQSFATSLVQTDRIDDRRIGQVFGMLLLLNGSLAVAQFALAPFAARYFGEPLIADMFPEAKMIACVRDIPWIMDSIENQLPIENSGSSSSSPSLRLP